MKVQLFVAMAVAAAMAVTVAETEDATYPLYAKCQSCNCSRQGQCYCHEQAPNAYLCGGRAPQLQRLDNQLVIDCNLDSESWNSSSVIVFNCSALPILPLARSKLPSLRLEKCKLPPEEPVSCSLQAGAVSSVRRLDIREGRNVPTEQNLRGLDLEEVWWAFQEGVVSSIPVEPLAQFPRLQKVTLHLGNSNVTLRAGMFSALSSVRSLELAMSVMQHIPAGTFSGMSALTELYLWDSLICTVHQDAFEGLQQLEVLDINQNPLQELPRDLHHTPALRDLYVRKTNLSALNDTVFQGAPHLRKIEIECIYQEARILNLSNHTFSNLTSLQHLNVDSCIVTSLPPDIFTGTTDLVYMKLNYMRITRVPVGLLSGLKHLKLFDLRANRIDQLQPGVLSGLEELEKIDLSQNKIELIPESVFSELPRLAEVLLRDNRLRAVSAAAFLSPSLQALDLSENNLSETAGWGWLRPLRNLTGLYLSGNQYTNISVAEMNLTEFRYQQLIIDLRKNHIHTASPGTSTGVHLLLDDNDFHCDCHLYPLVESLRTTNTTNSTNLAIDNDSLKNAKCNQPARLNGSLVLKVLHKDFSCEFSDSNCDCSYRPSLRSVECNCSNIDTLEALKETLEYNTTMSLRLPYIPPKLPEFVLRLIVSRCNLTTANLTSIPNVSYIDISWNNITHIPGELLDRNITLALAGNPLQCDCETTDFVKRLKSLGNRLNDSDNVTCNSNYELLKDKNPDDLCTVKVNYTTTAVVVSLLIFSAWVMFYFRHEIVMLVYAQGICRRIFLRKPDEKSNKIFVSYSPKNEDIVIKVNDYLKGRNVLLHDNLRAGLLVTPQIQEAVESSSIVLILLTKPYIESHIGRSTLQIAHNAGANTVVLLKGIQLNDLRVDIKSFLSTACVIPDRGRFYRARFTYAMRPCAV